MWPLQMIDYVFLINKESEQDPKCDIVHETWELDIAKKNVWFF